MSEDPQRIDPISAEHLIRGARSGSAEDLDPLAGLLAAAAAPAREEELAGEDTAVAAFRDARRALAPQPRRRFMLKSVLVKASLVAAVAAVGSGGVALAASAGHLPGTNSSEHPATAQNSHRPADATASRHASRPAASNASTHGVTNSHAADPSATPSPNLRGLCTAFQAHAADNPGKALENPAYKALIERAGGKNKVASFCAKLLDTPAGKSSTHRSDASTHASTHAPSHAPSSRPTTPRPTHSPSHPAPSTTNTHRP